MKLMWTVCIATLVISCTDQGETEATSKEVKPTPPQTGTLIAFEENELWGFRNEKGETVIEPQYLVANDFNEQGGAAVLVDDGWRFINKAGDVLVKPFIFDNGPDEFSGGLARFIETGKIGFYNPAGEIVIPARLDFAYPFEQGKAKACEGCQTVMVGDHSTIEGGIWFNIDKSGERIPEN